MKVKRSNEKVDFQPIEVTVTIESKEELDALNLYYNVMSLNDFERNSSEDCLILTQMLDKIYEATLD